MVQNYYIAAAKILYQISEYLGLYFTGENDKRDKKGFMDHNDNNTIDRINLHRN